MGEDAHTKYGHLKLKSSNMNAQKKEEKKSGQNANAAHGEDAALKGFTNQYLVAAELVYDALKDRNFVGVTLKEPEAGQIDDIVLVWKDQIDAYQVKWSDPPNTLTFSDFKNFISQLFTGRLSIQEKYPDKAVYTHLYTSNISSQSKVKEVASFAKFMQEYWQAENLDNDLIIKWKPVTDDLIKVLEIEDDLNLYRPYLKFYLNGKHPEAREDYNSQDRRYRDISHLAHVLLECAGKNRGKIELNREKIFNLAGWANRSEFRFKHVFETPNYYQPIESTASNLQQSISNASKGYIALIGTPGSGKSTLLTETLRYQEKIRLNSYYCFIPNDTSIHPRSEARNFLHDLVLSLKRHDIGTRNLTPGESLEQLREDFQNQLHELEARYKEDGIKTVILLDGLDHIRREGNPDRSLLCELPKPSAIPDGVLFVLGSQQIEQLELSNDVKLQLKEDAPIPRTIHMDQLSKRAVREITKGAINNFTLSSELIDKISEKSAGHPLALSYILNRIKDCTSLEAISAAIDDLPSYDGNIEAQYEGYWQALNGETSVLELLSFLSRIRGNIETDVIKKLAENEGVVSRLIEVAGHYFKRVSVNRLGFFHNSFRQFILEKTGRDAFNVSDESKHQEYHSKLAELASLQPPESPFSWEVLYHLYHSEKYEKVLGIGQQSYFRKHFLSGRCFDAILEDLDLVMKAAKHCKDRIAVIRVLLINEELATRDYILDERDFSQLLLKLGRTDEALAYVVRDGKLLLREYKALEFSKLLYDLGNRDLAREVFDLAEPIEKIEGTRHHYDLYAGEEILDQWVEAAIRFRSIKELADLISRFEADKNRNPNTSQQEENQNLREYYYFMLIDSVVSLNDPKLIEILSEEMAGYIPKNQVLGRIAWNILYSDTDDNKIKEKYFNLLIKDVGLKQFSDSQKILYCEFLIKKKQNIEQAKEIFKTIKAPSAFKENTYLPDSSIQSYYMKLFRYHRINSSLNKPENPEETVMPNANDTHRYVTSVARQVVSLANFWGRVWQGNPLSVEEFIELTKSALSLYENSQRPNANRNMKDAMGCFAKRYMEIIIHTARVHGIEYLEALEGLFQNKWENSKSPDVWSSWIRRTVSLILFECGLYQSNFVEIIQSLDQADPMLTPEGELREFLETCEEKALELYELGQEEKAYSYIEKMRRESFGVTHEKDTQINEWANLFADILEENSAVVKGDFIRIANGISTNAKYNRACYSSKGAIRLLSSVALYNANCAQKLKEFFWENDVLEFPHTVEALITAAAEDADTPLVVSEVLYRRLYLPYERYTNLDPIKIISKRLCFLENREEATTLLTHLKNAINQDVSEHTRGTWWSGFMEVFESIPNQEELLNEIRPCIERQKPKIDYTPGSVTLNDGTKIEEEDLVEQSKNPDRLLEIAKEIDGDNFYHWNRLIKPISHRLNKEKIEELLGVLLDNDKHGRDIAHLVEQLISLGELQAAEKYALEALSKSASHGWTRHYDGGSRLVPYELLSKIDKKYRERAFDKFIEDFLQGYKPRNIAHELENFLPVFWAKTPYEELWPEIREHIFQLREFSTPAIELPNDFSLEQTGDLNIALFAASLLFDSFVMPFIELREDALKAIAYLYEKSPELQSYVDEKIALYLSGNIESPLLGMAIIRTIYAQGNVECVHNFKEKLCTLLDSPNMSIRLFAKDTLKLISEDVGIRFEKELPAAYEIILPEFKTAKHGLLSSVLQPGAVLPNTNDPLQLVGIAQEALELINERTGIPIRNLAERCAHLMKQIVPFEKWNSDAERSFQSTARGLRIELSYRRPRVFVSFIALGYMVSELYDANIIDDDLLYLLRPSLLPYDSKIVFTEPIAENLSPSTITLTRDLFREAEWMEIEPVFNNQPPILENNTVVLGFVTQAELPSWEIPNELHIGSITSPDIDQSKIKQDPEYMIPGRIMSAWWQAEQYPGIPYLKTALENSLLVRGALKQRIEFGAVPWLAINPMVATELGWFVDEEGLFRWLNDTGSTMVESIWWQSGRLGRFPYADGVRASGWLVYATNDGYESLKEIMGNTLWGEAAVKQYGKRSCKPQQKAWCNFSVIE